MSGPLLADRVFDAALASAHAESDLGDALDVIVPGDAWEHFTTDWYDRSIEVYFYAATPPADPDAVARALFAHGFSLVWLHPHGHEARQVDGTLCRCPVRGAKRESLAIDTPTTSP